LQETGNGKIKAYIDSTLLKIAEQHLRYSDIPLNKIANQLHFSSIYAFSRYYKHHRGITPSEFRRREKESATE
ncbi:MAG: helix-turn-helix domain-containing protein, partial [Lentisphaeria bacterium]|nr:helix-turn-helix domain-containing protein [Lentisphaeria bacterium]